MVDIDKSGYLRTPSGIISGAIVVLAFLGGIVNIFSWGFTGFLGFAFWSTFFVSGSLLLMRVFQVYDGINTRFPVFWKIELGYIVIWIALYIVALILSFVGFGASAVFGWFILGLLCADAFMRYRFYRSSSGAPAASPPENIEQA